MNRPARGTHDLVAAWHRCVERAPDAPAIVDAATGRTCSRRELAAAARHARAALPERLSGRRVVFARPNGIDWFVRFLGLLEAGAVPVPADPTESAARQRELTGEIGAAGLWSGDAFDPNPASRAAPDRTTCLIKLTSGSTGRPRVLRFTAAQMLADGRQVVSSMDIRPDDVNLAVIPCGHSYGLGNLVMPLLIQGTAIVAARAALPRALAEDCERWRPTVFPAVPALLKLLCAAEVAPAALASLRTIISAGSPLAASVAQAFQAKFHRPVHNFYGSSETGGITYDFDGYATLTGRSVGAPLDGVRLSVGPGGRIMIESAAVHTLGNRARSAEGFGRHRAADRGRLDECGELVLIGRAGRLAKVGARRLDLGEVEAALREVPGVEEAFAVPHPSRDDELAAAVQTGLPEREVRAALAARLPAWKIPRRLVCLASFPLTARGKVDTAALRGRLGAG